MDRYISRLRKLKRISEKLEKLLQNISNITYNEITNSDVIEKLELLLFYVYEIALPSEREIWKKLSDVELMTMDLDLNEQLKRIDEIETLSKSISRTISELK